MREKINSKLHQNFKIASKQTFKRSPPAQPPLPVPVPPKNGVWDKKANKSGRDRRGQSETAIAQQSDRYLPFFAPCHTHPLFTLDSLHICDWSLFSRAFADGQSIASSAAWTCSTSSALPSHERSRRHDVTIDESRGRGARTCGASPLRPGPPRRRVGARGAKLNRSAPKTARWRARREVQSIGAAAAACSCSTSAVSSAVPTSSSRAPSSARLVCTSARSSSR